MSPKARINNEVEAFLTDLGRQIKTARKKMTLSQVEAAEQMAIDYRHYQNIEGGKINLRLDTLLKLFRFYNLNNDNQPSTHGLVNAIGGGDGAIKNESPTDLLFRYFSANQRAGIMELNFDRKVVIKVNATLAQMLGYTNPEAIAGRPISELINENDLLNLDQAIQTTLPPGEVAPRVVRLKHGLLPSNINALLVPKHQYMQFQGQVLTTLVLDRQALDSAGNHLQKLNAEYQRFLNYSSML